MDDAISKLDSLEKQGSAVKEQATAATEPVVSDSFGASADEYAGYAEMREKQRDLMFSDGSEEASGESLRAGRLTSAGLQVAQGHMPTNFLLREALAVAGVTGPWAMLAMFGIDIAIKEIVSLQTEAEFNKKMNEYEARRKVNYTSAYRGVMTE